MVGSLQRSREIPMKQTFPQADPNWLVAIRRDLHRHPELAYQEKRTAARVGEILSDLGWQVRHGVGRTGIVALLGDPASPCLAFRADMDALPIGEAKSSRNASYRSVHRGVMHACGHDAHMTILLGVAKVLAEHPDLLEVSGVCVKLLFQPAEEVGTGAREMIEHGALDSPRPRAILAGHVSPELEVGSIGLSKSVSHASADSFRIKVIGKGGHGAHPEQCRDPIVAASHLVSQLQTIVSRRVDPLDSAVVTIGRIAGGTALNVIPGDVELEGTVRSLREETRELLWDRIQAAARACEFGFGVTCMAERVASCPPCTNDTDVVGFLRDAVSKVLGEDRIKSLAPSMGAEDFAYYTSILPGAIVRLGCANREEGIGWDEEDGGVVGLHSPNFEIDEAVLPIGVRIFLQAVIRAHRLTYFKG